MSRTPTQQRAWDDLLAVNQPRPAPDPSWLPDLRARLERAADRAARHLDAGATLRVNKTALDALDCDGRYLDLRSQPFTWSEPLLAGKLAHRAIELDHAGGSSVPSPSSSPTPGWRPRPTVGRRPRSSQICAASPPTACVAR